MRRIAMKRMAAAIRKSAGGSHRRAEVFGQKTRRVAVHLPLKGETMAATIYRSPKRRAGLTLSKVAGAATPYLQAILAEGGFGVGDAGHTF